MTTRFGAFNLAVVLAMARNASDLYQDVAAAA